MKKNSLVLCLFLFFLSMFLGNTFADESPLKIVASTVFFKSLAEHIGGERVQVSAVASPRSNVHFIQPKPTDVARTAKADLFVFAGLDLEAWADPLLEASGREDLFRGGARNVDLSAGIELKKIPQVLTRAEGDIHAYGNPHYTLDPRNARQMAMTLAKRLKEIDPAHASYYDSRLKSFLTKLDLKMGEWKKICAACSGKTIVSYHDDIVYLADFLEVREGLYLEPKPGVPPTPNHLAQLEVKAKNQKVIAVAGAAYESERTLRRFAERIGVKVIRLMQTPGEMKGTEDLFDFYDQNVKAIASAA